MPTINPKQYKEVYKEQEKLSEFKQPPTGIYHVVNTTLQFQIVGRNKTKKLRVRAHILRCVEGQGGGDFVGKQFSFDLWWNLSKELYLTRVALLGIAVTGDVDKQWDPDNNEQLVENLTGAPYLINISTEAVTFEGKTRDEITVKEVKTLTAEQRAMYAKAPDWQKTIGNKKDRLLEEKDFTAQANSSGGGQQKDRSSNTPTSSGDPFKDDDIPH